MIKKIKDYSYICFSKRECKDIGWMPGCKLTVFKPITQIMLERKQTSIQVIQITHRTLADPFYVWESMTGITVGKIFNLFVHPNFSRFYYVPKDTSGCAEWN